MIRTQIQLEETQYRALKELAVRQRTSVAELIRRAVREMLENAMMVPDQERRRRSLNVVGKFHSGCSDIAERHDDYLAEVYGEW
jgi:metal-responsive CopG/Arc/MetJ family transcriptional regulator